MLLYSFVNPVQNERIFLRRYSSIIGLRFVKESSLCPGFCMGDSIPPLCSCGWSHVLPVLLGISAMIVHTLSGPYLSCAVVNHCILGFCCSLVCYGDTQLCFCGNLSHRY